MTGHIKTKLLALAILGISTLFSQRAEALIPVIDTPSILNTAKEWVNGIKESTFVVNTTTTITKVSSAIGDVKKSVSEYVTDNVEKIKKSKQFK